MQIHYSLDSGVATIRMDDGKRNALSPQMFKELNAALDQAERDRAIVILTGREEVFSAGFDLKVMKAGGADALRMLHAELKSKRALGRASDFARAVVHVEGDEARGFRRRHEEVRIRHAERSGDARADELFE